MFFVDGGEFHIVCVHFKHKLQREREREKECKRDYVMRFTVAAEHWENVNCKASKDL